MMSTDAFNAIESLDLNPIKLKLMHHKTGEGWSQAKANAMETEYRRFLYLQAVFPDEQTAPTLDVDTFWHYHILDTVKYAADCAQAFGYFLHHAPAGVDEMEEVLESEAGERTRRLYEATFGQAYIRAEAYGAEPCEAGSQALCAVAGPAALGHASARCTGLCIVARPTVQSLTSAPARPSSASAPRPA